MAATMAPDPLCPVFERLCTEFEATYAPLVIIAVMASCRDQLDIATPGALPELTERLARERLAHQAIDTG